jgi:hypothetical protein
MRSTPLAAAIAIALSAPLTTVSAQAAAPSDSAKTSFTIGSTQTMGGYVKFGFDALDARMAAAGLPAAASGAATIGFGADLRTSRLLFGAGYQSLVTQTRSDPQYRTRMSGGFSLFDVGYAAFQSRRLTVFPVFGVGATRLSVNVKERGDFTFDDALQTPARELRLSGTAAVVHAGIVMEQRFSRRGSEYGVGLRIGRIGSIGGQSWSSADSKVTDGPSGISGTYVRIVMSKSVRRRRDSALPIAATLAQAVVR